MANTEKVGILKQVRETQTETTEALSRSGLTQVQRDVLDDLRVVLTEIDNYVLLNELNDCIEGLREKSKKLKKLNTRMKKKIENLEDISARVEHVAKAIDAVIKAFGILVGAGII